MALCLRVLCDINQWPYWHATLILKSKQNVAKFLKTNWSVLWQGCITEPFCRNCTDRNYICTDESWVYIRESFWTYLMMCQIGKNRKGIVIQRFWVFEFRDPVLYFRDVSELRVPPNLILFSGETYCTRYPHHTNRWNQRNAFWEDLIYSVMMVSCGFMGFREWD